MVGETRVRGLYSREAREALQQGFGQYKSGIQPHVVCLRRAGWWHRPGFIFAEAADRFLVQVVTPVAGQASHRRVLVPGSSMVSEISAF